MLKNIVKALLLVTMILLPTCSANAYTVHDVPSNSGVKNYMDYRAITLENSRQMRLQETAVTNGLGIRTVDNRYCVAIGTGYGLTVGECFDAYTSTGNTLQCIVADIKQDIHTDATNKVCDNGNIIEFVVETESVNSLSRATGSLDTIDVLSGSITKMVSMDEEDSTEAEVDNRYVVTAKYEVPQVNGEMLYTLEVKTPIGGQSILVSLEEYEKAVVNYTTISLN